LHCRCFLAQAQSNKAPKGKKSDMADSKRLVRRFIAGELFLSFVPEPEQQGWRTLTRGKLQLTRDRSAIVCQVEALLEEARIKISAVVADLWGASGKRILHALAGGESDPERLAALGSTRLKCTPEKLKEALTGAPEPVHRFMLKNHLERLDLLDRQIEDTNRQIAEQLRSHQDAVMRLTKIPGLRVDAAQQILAELGVSAAAFEAPEKLSSWGGLCPGRNESAGVSGSTRSSKGNPYYRRILTQVAQAAVRTKGSYFETLFRRLAPRLGFAKAIWAVAHRISRIIWKILHEGVEYIEHGTLISPQGKQRRIQRLTKELRLLGYSVVPSQP
jgi:transposase